MYHSINLILHKAEKILSRDSYLCCYIIQWKNNKLLCVLNSDLVEFPIMFMAFCETSAPKHSLFFFSCFRWNDWMMNPTKFEQYKIYMFTYIFSFTSFLSKLCTPVYFSKHYFLKQRFLPVVNIKCFLFIFF